MGYALASVSSLKACPFCREMFAEGEASECPLCGVALTSFASLPVSNDPVDAFDEDDEGRALGPVDPDERVLPWTHAGDGRGALVALSLAGLVAFMMPWVVMHAPDEIALMGYDLAKRSPPAWAAGVAWFTILPMVLSRRTKRDMRRTRLAAAGLAILPALVIGILLLNPPTSAHMRGITVHLRFTWGPGIFAALGVSVIGALVAALRFGGKPAT